MNIEVPIPDKDYKVLVRCATYNHSKYIRDALNGFAIQETDFPFICIVVDDASKDGNQEVIKQYANDNCDMSKAEISEDDISKYIRVPHKTNENCVFLFCLLKVNLYGKPEKREIYKPYREVCEYEALCEGDDWWIDEKKLQKQFDILDNCDNIVMVRTDADVLVQATGELKKNVFKNKIYPNSIDSFRDYVISPRWLATCSWMYRISVSDYCNIPADCFKGDLALMIYAAKIGEVKFIEDSTSVYRILQSSASHFESYERAHDFWRKQVNTRCYYAKDLNFQEKFNLIRKLLGDARHYYIANKKQKKFDFHKYISFAWDIYNRILNPQYESF